MKKLTFREAQLGSYEILKFLDQLCRKNGLTYFLMYGSLIGAVREKGIIPWDDDVDIMMPRPDYDRLLDLCSHTDTEPFRLFENSLMPEYPHTIARMSDQRYRLDFANEKDYGIGLFVDIFPLDGAGNDFRAARKLAGRSYPNASLCFLTSRKRFGVDNTRSKLRLIAKFPAYLWANLMGNRHYQKKARALCSTFSYEDSRFVSGIAQARREHRNENKNIYQKEWFEVIEADFEDGKFFIPKEYDRILKMLYGDYMTPLPEDERGTHHNYDAYYIG